MSKCNGICNVLVKELMEQLKIDSTSVSKGHQRSVTEIFYQFEKLLSKFNLRDDSFGKRSAILILPSDFFTSSIDLLRLSLSYFLDEAKQRIALEFVARVG